jgi:hypothetical protein
VFRSGRSGLVSWSHESATCVRDAERREGEGCQSTAPVTSVQRPFAAVARLFTYIAAVTVDGRVRLHALVGRRRHGRDLNGNARSREPAEPGVWTSPQVSSDHVVTRIVACEDDVVARRRAGPLPVVKGMAPLRRSIVDEMQSFSACDGPECMNPGTPSPAAERLAKAASPEGGTTHISQPTSIVLLVAQTTMGAPAVFPR